MNVRTQSLARRLTLKAFIAASCAGIAWGQATNSADVTGIVIDPSGVGVYDTGPLLPTDHYVLIFKKEGFVTGDHSGHSTYHAGMIRVEKRYSSGIQFLTSYVFSKLLTDADGYWRSDQHPATNADGVEIVLLMRQSRKK